MFLKTVPGPGIMILLKETIRDSCCPESLDGLNNVDEGATSQSNVHMDAGLQVSQQDAVHSTTADGELFTCCMIDPPIETLEPDHQSLHLQWV